MDQIISALDDLKGGKEWRTAAETESSDNRTLKTTFWKISWAVLHCPKRLAMRMSTIRF